jgi:hypothetical protein
MTRFAAILMGALIAAPAAGIATARQTATDIAGWDAAKWGMTESEVASAFKGKAQKARKPKVINGVSFTLTTSGITFATLKGTVEFGFAQSDGRLQQVTFVPDKEYWDDFEILDRHLTGLFGPQPRKQDPQGSVPLGTTVVWRLNTSSIVLYHAGNRDSGRKMEGMVFLRYATNPTQ